jgi:hypothetical protein
MLFLMAVQQAVPLPRIALGLHCERAGFGHIYWLEEERSAISSPKEQDTFLPYGRDLQIYTEWM